MSEDQYPDLEITEGPESVILGVTVVFELKTNP